MKEVDSGESRPSPVDEWRTFLGRIGEDMSDDEREDLSASICLAGRSAYTDFFTAVVHERTINPTAQSTLDHLFQRSIAAMPDDQYKAATANRYEEFKEVCEDQGQRSPDSSGIVLV
jgi:hypothetical protein